MTSESDIERRIIRCVDDGLQALGDEGRRAIYYHLEKNLTLKREEIPQKPEVFWKGLTAIFGEKGANTIETWIVKRLRTTFEIEHQSTVTLAEAIATIKMAQRTEREKKKGNRHARG